jgi:hypothetical protein
MKKPVKSDPMAEDTDHNQRIFDLMMEIEGFKRVIDDYTTNKIRLELENIPRVSDFNNEVDEYINKRIAELKALNHRKER